MTDQELLRILQETERRCQEGRQSGMRDALEFLDRSTRGRVRDRTQRDAVYRVCQGLSDRSMRHLDETLEVLTEHVAREMRNLGKTLRYAENYGADKKTIHSIMHEQVLTPMIDHCLETMRKHGLGFDQTAVNACKSLVEKLTDTTMTSTELQVQLDAALKAEAAAAAAKEADDKLVYHIDLATATKNLLQAIRAKQTGAVTLLAQFRKVLAPLAREFGFKVILVGAAAYVVPR